VDAAAARAGLVLAMLAHLAAAAAALLTLFVVKEIADRQERRVERIGIVRGLASRPNRERIAVAAKQEPKERMPALVHGMRGDSTVVWGRY
jgi:hypothetical protein